MSILKEHQKGQIFSSRATSIICQTRVSIRRSKACADTLCIKAYVALNPGSLCSSAHLSQPKFHVLQSLTVLGKFSVWSAWYVCSYPFNNCTFKLLAPVLGTDPKGRAQIREDWMSARRSLIRYGMGVCDVCLAISMPGAVHSLCDMCCRLLAVIPL